MRRKLTYDPARDYYTILGIGSNANRRTGTPSGGFIPI
jgi:hypothetical protein